MRTIMSLLALTIVTLCASASPQDADPPIEQTLDTATFETWRAWLTPTAEEEAWRTIPWRNSMWQAVLDAQQERKPILLWAMNGHPMGCT